MNSTHASLRGTAAVLAAAALLSGPALAAPKKPEPAPATEPAPAPKKGVFGKLKSAIGIGRKTEVPAPPAPAADAKIKSARSTKTAPAVPAPGEKLKEPKVSGATASTKSKPASKASAGKPVPPPPAVEPVPEKKGLLRRLLTRDQPKTDPAVPELAKAKTARPAPVKELKPVKPAPATTVADGQTTEPERKRGFFSFLRGKGSKIAEADAGTPVPDSLKIERPDDWKDHRVVNDDSIALYGFGPSQGRPDERLSTGTLVKVKSIKSGWAFVEVTGGRTGYMDASALRLAAKTDFKDPVVPMTASASTAVPNYWAPAAPPPDLPDQPGAGSEQDPALLLLPPLELEPKANP